MRSAKFAGSLFVVLAVAFGTPGGRAQEGQPEGGMTPAGGARGGAAAEPPVSPTASGGRVVESPAEHYEAWEIYEGLGSGVRTRPFALRARSFLSRHGVTIDDSEFERINDALHDLAYSRDPRERSRRQLDLNTLIAELQSRIAAIMPPVSAFDVPGDDGGAVGVFWRPVAGAKEILLEGREFVGSGAADPPWKELKRLAGRSYAEPKPMDVVFPGRSYQFRISAVGESGEKTEIGTTAKVRASRNWFNWNRGYYLIFIMVLCSAVVFYIWLAQRGVTLRIRKIAGLEAIDEAVGRATEMGRPVLFIAGIQDMDNIQTVAGLTVLGRVAKTAAEHDALLEVPTARSLVMTAARETVHTAFMNAGRPDAYNEKKIYYVTDEQFGFVAATTGLIVRERPAACVYMGAFYAESLILAETANTVGSIQIAGTAEPAQLPFFVAACDYTLIGEEFFAASAYLSGEPRQLGSLKGQDIGKAIVMIFTLFGAVLITLVTVQQQQFTFLGDIVDFMRQSFLSVSD